MIDHDMRYTTLDDTVHLRSWLSEPTILRWFPMSDPKEIEDAVAAWMSFSKYQCSLTATVEGEACGMATLFLMPYRKVAHRSIFKLVVSPKYQRQGIGSSLLKNLKHLAKTHFRLELIQVEIFEGNPILELLLQQGFKEFARQAGAVKAERDSLARILLEAVL